MEYAFPQNTPYSPGCIGFFALCWLVPSLVPGSSLCRHCANANALMTKLEAIDGGALEYHRLTRRDEARRETDECRATAAKTLGDIGGRAVVRSEAMDDQDNPCAGLCIIDEAGYCQGCGRSEEENYDQPAGQHGSIRQGILSFRNAFY